MKTFNLLLIITVLFVGCRSTKKLTESSAVIENKTEVNHKFDVKEETKVNNDKTTYKNTTITETEFSDIVKPTDASNASGKSTEPTEAKRAVKAIKVTVIEEGTADQTKTEIKKVDNSQIETKTEDKSEVKNTTTEKKTVPIQWGWIFGILTLGFVAFIYFGKSGIATIVKTFIKKLFA